MIPKEIMKLYEKLAFSRGYEEAFFGIFWMFVFTICLSGCWREDYRRVEKDISHMNGTFCSNVL